MTTDRNDAPLQGIISKYGLEAEKAGYFTGYDINIDPGVANSVATAALRFVASMMGSSLALRNGVSLESETVPRGRTVSAGRPGLTQPGPLELTVHRARQRRVETQSVPNVPRRASYG